MNPREEYIILSAFFVAAQIIARDDEYPLDENEDARNARIRLRAGNMAEIVMEGANEWYNQDGSDKEDD